MDSCYFVYQGTWQCFWGGMAVLSLISVFFSGAVAKDFGIPREVGIVGGIFWLIFCVSMLIGVAGPCWGWW